MSTEHELAKHAVKMSCYCPSRHRTRNEDGSSECRYCGRTWNTEEDKARAKRAARLQMQSVFKNGALYTRREEIEQVMWGGRDQGKAVWLEYIDRNNELTERLIKPVRVKKSTVKAHCFVRDDERLFVYDRIHRCRVVDHAG